MITVLVIIGVLILIPLVALLWDWLSEETPDQFSQITFEKQLAIWRIEAISRQSQEEMRRIRDEARRRSLTDQEPPSRADRCPSAPHSLQRPRPTGWLSARTDKS